MDYVVFDRNIGKWITKEEHEELIKKRKLKKMDISYFNNFFILDKKDALYKYFQKQIETAIKIKQIKMDFLINEKK